MLFFFSMMLWVTALTRCCVGGQVVLDWCTSATAAHGRGGCRASCVIERVASNTLAHCFVQTVNGTNRSQDKTAVPKALTAYTATFRAWMSGINIVPL